MRVSLVSISSFSNFKCPSPSITLKTHTHTNINIIKPYYCIACICALNSVRFTHEVYLSNLCNFFQEWLWPSDRSAVLRKNINFGIVDGYRADRVVLTGHVTPAQHLPSATRTELVTNKTEKSTSQIFIDLHSTWIRYPFSLPFFVFPSNHSVWTHSVPMAFPGPQGKWKRW